MTNELELAGALSDFRDAGGSPRELARMILELLAVNHDTNGAEPAPPQNEALRQSWARGQCAMVGAVAESLPNDTEKDAIVEEVFARATQPKPTPPQPAPLHLQVGHRYRARDGREWDCVHDHGRHVIDTLRFECNPVVAGESCLFSWDGGYYTNETSPRDLIEDLGPTPSAKPADVDDEQTRAMAHMLNAPPNPLRVKCVNQRRELRRLNAFVRFFYRGGQLQDKAKNLDYRLRKSQWKKDRAITLLAKATGVEYSVASKQLDDAWTGQFGEDASTADFKVDIDAVLAPIERALEHIAGLSNDTRASEIATTAYGVAGNVLRQAIAKARGAAK